MDKSLNAHLGYYYTFNMLFKILTYFSGTLWN